MAKIKSKKLRDSARNRSCTLRLVDVCNHMDETVVLAHVGYGGGMGTKCGDNMAVFACSSCHMEIDGANRDYHAPDIIRALGETQQIWIDGGLMCID